MSNALGDVQFKSKDGIADQIERDKDEFVEKLRTLCQQPSVSAQNLGLKETAEIVGRFMQEAGFTVQSFLPSKGPPVLYGEVLAKRGAKTMVV